MDIETIGAVGTMIVPIYFALFSIYRSIGKFDRVCREFDELKRQCEKEGQNVSS
jgi:hypothetical protein